jgi:hypothetical protein
MELIPYLVLSPQLVVEEVRPTMGLMALLVVLVVGLQEMDLQAVLVLQVKATQVEILTVLVQMQAVVAVQVAQEAHLLELLHH